ncbi:MAG TPA: zf-HC2 domain-containing protein [Jatrophihabitans sp.]|nr:zf-HC2 domain-containing protein [Jatrophihabitans sp.]
MTTAEHERFAHDDGAYLLGALAPAERAAYEQHLAGCPRCQESLAELAGLPALLAGAEPDVLADEDGAGPPPPALLPRLLAEAGQQRARLLARTAAAGFLAACLLVAGGIGGARLWSHAHRPATLALQQVGPNPDGVHATVRLVADGTQTRIRLDCGYVGTGALYPASPPSYRMLAVNRAGATRDLGSWAPLPGEDVQLTRTSPWPRVALAGIEIADQRGTVVLRLAL